MPNLEAGGIQRPRARIYISHERMIVPTVNDSAGRAYILERS